ncbi:two-component system response regulator [Wenyingzhuangia fucanilytica]|uniref:Two-component system response regulator n=1 Tax=Wenyingzhuangia fucanilytica TaxID=1790137 RepID=A0A1B1Y4H0_9FLAO|nr:response regulator transcription factor [Wenyingzhuangia fucanilytica]ANW95637.1 two-component system response regulator [Wenyingzhuangia fucanilytica]
MENKKHKILLVEDDVKVCSFINQGLTEQNFEVTIALNGAQGYELASTINFDLLILDIMLPEMNGLDICKAVRVKNNQVPILFLTALGSTENIALGLNSGADDYLTKPFKFIELTARINSLLRRSVNFKPQDVDENVFSFADVELNDTTKTVTRNNEKLNLTSTEYKLLLAFLKWPKRVLSRVELLENVWGVNYDIGTNVVDVYVNYLRKKLDKNNGEKLIHTVIGMGYVLKHNDEDTN